MSTGDPAVIRDIHGRGLDRIYLADHMVDDEDLAVALGNTCRYGCRVRRFYSVAQHLLLCSMVVPTPRALTALLHDAEEAYVGGDIPTPEKRRFGMDWLVNTQAANRRTVLRHYGLPDELPEWVHEVDMRMRATEYRDLFGGVPDHMAGYLPYEDIEIYPMAPEWAAEVYLNRLRFLTRDRNSESRVPRQEQFGEIGVAK